MKTNITEKRPLVFTAYSKKNFFCRDMISEFVFKMGNVPLNPFKNFDYFLRDKVKRDFVRRANNNLLMVADALWVFGDVSDGVLKEIKLAKSFSLETLFYALGNSIEDIQLTNHVKLEPPFALTPIDQRLLKSTVESEPVKKGEAFKHPWRKD